MTTFKDSRTEVLQRIRQQLSRNEANEKEAQDAASAWLAAHKQGPRPRPLADNVTQFCNKSLALSSTVERVPNFAAAPAAVARYMAQENLIKHAVCWPSLSHLDWASAGVSCAFRGALDADTVGITGAFCAIAETGTLMLLSDVDTPATVSLLPETHIAILPASRIVVGMEEAWQLLRDEVGTVPRAVNFISGPSRTGDIEQTIVLGAHGPYRVHIILVGANII